MKKALSMLLVLVMLLGMMPLTAFATEEEHTHTYENGICTGCGEKLSFEGKTISILGDSISTYAGISNDSTVNATLSGSTIYYGQGALGGYRHTWWQQIIDTLGMDLLVNNSWSGTCVLKTRGTVGAYIDRCVQLHNDRTGEQPDVIAVFMGTNDYSYYQSTLGTAEIDYAALITDRGDGTFDYAKPTTTCEAYAIMLHKMTQRYPDAEIYCLGMLSRRDPDHDGREVVPPPTSFNAELKAIVERFGGTYVDVESCIPATASEFDQYMIDRRVHPNAAGMDKITEAVVGTMLQRQVTLRNVSYDLHNVSCSKEPAAVIENERLELTLAATDKDLDLAVCVTMGGEDITSQCYANGKVSIAKVTGDIVITAMVLHRPSDYLWQFDNGELVSAGTNANQLTKLAGSTQDNVFRETRYQLAVTAELIHTRPWVIEWAGEGKGGFMLSQASSSTGAPFFIRRSGNYLTAFGHYNNDHYDNYGLTLDAANINGAEKHVYRLENRIAQNGSNMVWLLVDGIEIGALNNYYIAGTSQGSTADWISGKDFHVNYIGSSSHPLSGYALEYLSITECAHIFSNGICTICGEIENDGIWQIVENGEVIGSYADLQSAIDACETGGTVRLTANCAVTSGVQIKKDITIDGGNFLVDISGCAKEFINIARNVAVTLRDLKLDGGATGFEVDYDAVTYTDFAIPLKAGSLDNDPMAETSAILSFGKELICDNVDISNRYTASYGAAMQIRSGILELTDCDFSHNYGSKQGGALYIANSFGTMTEYPITSVTINNCTFTENYTGHGGAIYAMNVAQMSITNSLFDRNTANGGKGGAIDLPGQNITKPVAMEKGLDYMQTTINNCVFSNNWAGNDGFAIQSYDSDLYIYNSDFIGNVGVHQGSSVGTVSIESYRYTDPSQRIYTLMDGCLFEGNRGPCAVYGDHNSISDLDVRNCEFRNNTGKDSFLLYSAVSNITNCRFVGETAESGVIDAIIIENYDIPPVLTLTDVSFTDCTAPAEILTRKYGHDAALQTYNVILQGTTNGDIAIWDKNAVSVQGNHTGSVQLAFDTERSSLTIGEDASVNGIIYAQPQNAEAPLGERYCVTAEAEGESLTYQWYYKDAGMKNFAKSSNKTASYAYTMQSYMHNRQVYCVITDANGDSVQTETATITRPPMELTILQQPQDAQQEIGQKFSIKPTVQGDGLTYQWYYKDAGMKNFAKSSNRTSAYAYTMQSYMKGRQVYCVITDKYGNSVTTDVATISLPPVELKILEQPSDVYAVKGEKFSISFVVQGDGLTYQWYYKESYMKDFKPSSNKTSAYAYSMQNYMDGRSVYCVITDQYGNQITTEIVTIDKDDGIYYLTESAEGTYTIYTLAKDGSRKYELNFTGTMNSNTNTITVTKVTSYPAEGVIIPALTTYTADKAVYAVSINPASPFADLGTMSASVSIIPVDGKKVGLTSTVLSNMFKRNDGTNFVSLDLSGLDTSNVTTMSYMFNGCSSLAELDLSGFDTANVTNMSTMFNGCSSLTELDISGFDTAKVTNMYYMFGSCSGLTKLDLSGFDTSNVTNMANMFRGCSSLTELAVSGFDTAKVTNMSWMFSGCKNLYDLDLSYWDMSKANTANMFYNCPAGA